MKIPRSNLGSCVQKFFLTFRTIFVHNTPCSAKRRASDKDLPVSNKVTISWQGQGRTATKKLDVSTTDTTVFCFYDIDGNMLRKGKKKKFWVALLTM